MRYSSKMLRSLCVLGLQTDCFLQISGYITVFALYLVFGCIKEIFFAEKEW